MGFVSFFDGVSSANSTGFGNKFITTGDGLDTGVFNGFDGSGDGDNVGLNNQIRSGGDGNKIGVFSEFVDAGNGVNYGSFTSIFSNGTGNKFGDYTFIDATSGGEHYGIFSDVRKVGTYAAAFIGTVGIASTPTLTDIYNFPRSRGAQGQVLELTDNVVTLGWVTNNSANKSFHYQAASATYTLTTADYTVVAEEGQGTIVLPDPTTNNGRIIVLIGYHNITTAVNLTTPSGIIFDPVNNVSITTLTAGNILRLHSTGTEWWLIGN